VSLPILPPPSQSIKVSTERPFGRFLERYSIVVDPDLIFVSWIRVQVGKNVPQKRKQ
jgi:hypothetical protein